MRTFVTGAVGRLGREPLRVHGGAGGPVGSGRAAITAVSPQPGMAAVTRRAV